jgi:hypothetical protein
MVRSGTGGSPSQSSCDPLTEGDDKDSPTLPPPFDLEEYAQEHMSRVAPLVAPSETPTIPVPSDPPSSTRLSAASSGGAANDGLHARLAERLFAGDFAGALTLAQDPCANSPADARATSFAEDCRSVLESVRTYHVGSLDQVPRLVVPFSELRSLSLDHEAGFILSRVDGASTLESLLDVCAMPRLKMLRLVAKLVDYGVIRLEANARGQ